MWTGKQQESRSNSSSSSGSSGSSSTSSSSSMRPALTTLAFRSTSSVQDKYLMFWYLYICPFSSGTNAEQTCPLWVGQERSLPCHTELWSVIQCPVPVKAKSLVSSQWPSHSWSQATTIFWYWEVLASIRMPRHKDHQRKFENRSSVLRSFESHVTTTITTTPSQPLSHNHYRRWTNYSNPDITPTPPISMLFVFTKHGHEWTKQIKPRRTKMETWDKNIEIQGERGDFNIMHLGFD